jgi:glutamate N-acetyltransferase/amino-acid N-acetyltransferase
MFHRKKWPGVAAGVALAVAGPLVLSACGGAQGSSSTLTLGVITPATTFKAPDMNWGNESTYNQAVYDSLVQASPTGVIEPHLATMFCFVATDAAVARGVLNGLIRRAVDHSFNRVTVDSDTSTSDTVAILANGLAENRAVESGGRGLRQFAAGVEALMGRLARMLVEDAEGGTKVVTFCVRGAASRRDALIAARSVANSPLVKTAVNGADPNWGRIMMALGKSAARIDQDKIAITFGEERMVERGVLREGVRVERIREIMGAREFEITIDLGLGRGEDRVLTSDLSEEYVRINGKYTT